MSGAEDRSLELTARRPDRFQAEAWSAVSHRESHGCETWVPSLADARYLASIVAAARATYVLTFVSGLGYLALHLSEVFGHTGRLDVLENDPVHASLLEQAARDHSLADRINVHRGNASQVVSSLNGPFDVVLLGPALADVAPLYADLVRLLRVGGTLVVADAAAAFTPSGEDPDARGTLLARGFLDRLAADDQFYSAFPPNRAPVVAVRRR